MTPIMELNKIIPMSGTEENEQLCEAVNTRNVQSVDKTLFEKLFKRKWWLFGIVMVIAIGGTVVGSIHSTRTKASTMTSTASSTTIKTLAVTDAASTTSSISLASLAPTESSTNGDVKEAVLMLSTYRQSNVPMVITPTGEFRFDLDHPFRN